MKKLMALAISLAIATSAYAHEIWIELHGNEARAYFGHLDRDLREVSPGRLDRIIVPKTAYINAAGEASPLPASFEQDHIALTLPSALSPGDSLAIIHHNGPVYVKNGIGTHWIMSARYTSSGVEPIAEHLELDIIPTGDPGAFRVVFEGEALTNAKVRLTHQLGWSMHRVSDQDGIVRFPALPWEGLYMVYAKHLVERKGSRERTLTDGSTEIIEHDQRGFITTLTFSVAEEL